MQRHPFDVQRSGRDPFPCFTAAMQLPDGRAGDSDSDDGDDGDDDGGCACDDTDACECDEPAQSLNWSIGELATLLPRSFSPLSSQKRTPLTQHRARRRRRWSTGTSRGLSPSVPQLHLLIEETPPRSATFFEDDRQFGVLRTPAEVIQREHQMGAHPQESNESQCTDWRAPGASRWRDLHRRCVDTIQICEARVRERQLRLARIQIPATKLKLKRRASNRQSSSTQKPISTTSSGAKSSSTVEASQKASRDPFTPEVATRLSFGSIDISPIPLDQSSVQLHEPLMMTPTQKPSRVRTNTDSAAFSSPALSSITENPSDVLTPSFASLQFSPSRDYDQEDEEKENKENSPSLSMNDEDTSSLKTLSLLHGATPGPSSSASTDSPPSGRSTDSVESSQKRRDLDEDASIAARQKLFMAAIEEEAQVRDGGRKDGDRPSHIELGDAKAEFASAVASEEFSAMKRQPDVPIKRKVTESSPPLRKSVASIYKEARALGLTEPTAQWEYVQLISRQAKKSSSQRLSL